MATVYKIHNLSRSVETRHMRAAATAQRAPKKLLLGGGMVRVVRGRPAPVTEAAVRRMQSELLKKEQLGWIKVTDAHGQRVDLNTLKPMEAPPVDPPKPNPPLDSAANDKQNVGEGLPQHPGGAALTDKLDKPSVVTDKIPEGTEEEDMEAVYQAVYDSWSKKDLEGLMEEYGVEDSSGNKMDLAKRLADAGLRVAEDGENGD